MLNSMVGSWPYPQIMVQAGQALNHITKTVIYGRKKSYRIGPWCRRKFPNKAVANTSGAP
jgi:hypothetical protein